MLSNFEKDPVGIILGIIFSRKRIIISAFLSVFCVTLIGVRMMPPVYESYTKLHINPPSMNRQLDMPALDDITNRTFIGNQREIIRSRAIYDRVVAKLNLSNIVQNETFLSKFKTKVKENFFPDKVLIDNKEVAIDFIKKTSSVEFIRGTNIALIAARSPSPNGAALLANTIAEVYMNYTNSAVSSLANEAYRSIEQQVKETQSQLNEVETELNVYKEKYNILMAEEEKESILSNLSGIEDELQKIDLGLLEINRAIGSIKQETPNSEYNITASGQENIKTLNNQLIALESSLTSALTTVTEDHPNVKQIRSQIKQTKEQIKNIENTSHRKFEADGTGTMIKDQQLSNIERAGRELNNKRQILAQRKDQLLQKKVSISERLIGFNKISERYQNLKTKMTMLNATFDSTKLQIAGRYSEIVKILEPAYPPPYPTTTKTKILLALGIFVGIVFGLGVAFIADYFDDRFKSITDLESSVELPVIGAIPKFSKRTITAIK